MITRIPIDAERVRLVPLTRPAAQDLLAGGDGGVVALQGWPHAGTLVAVRAAVESDDADALPWLIILRDVETAELAGVIGDLGCKGAPDPDGAVEIGYGVAAPYRRLGYATEAVGALLAWLDRRPDVRVVRAEVLADNLASRSVVERLGFEIDRLDGGYLWYRRPAAPPG